MNVMVVDDEIEISEAVEKQILDYADRNITEVVRVIKKNSQYDIEEYVQKGNPVDIIFMDIRLGDGNGIEIAKKMQSDNDELKVVFITGFDDYYMQIFDADPISFIRKPILQEHVDKVMDKIMSRKKDEIGEKIVFHTNKALHVQEIDKIIYVEAVGKKTKIVTIDNEYVINKSFGEIEGELEGKLIKCHRSYMININRVKVVSKHSIIMHNNDVVSLSRNYYNKIFQLYWGGDMDGDN